MTECARSIAWRTAIVLGYFARPWSCGVTLGLEPRPADDPYHSIDPHGFGVMGAFGAALLLAAPVLWLLLQRRGAERADDLAAYNSWRGIVVFAVIDAPMVMQLPYARLPLPYAWPVVVSSAFWLGLVASVGLNRSTVGPSLDSAFERRPLASWSIVLAIAVAKITFILWVLTY